MYCPSCGSEISDTHTFCPSCGKALTNSVWENEQTSAARRDEVADNILQLCTQFEGQKDKYDRMEVLDTRVVTSKAKLKKYGLIIVAVVWALIYLTPIFTVSPSEDLSHFEVVIVNAMFVGIALAPLAIVILAKVFRKMAIQKNSAEMGRLYNETYDHYQTVKGNPFAFEYCDPYSLYAIYQIVRMGKADTAKEAVNILEESRYRSATLNLQGQILEEARGAKEAAIAAAVFAGIGAIRK